MRFDLVTVVEKLKESMRQQFPNVRDVFRRFDEDKDGVLTQAEFKAALAKYGFHLSDEEVIIVMKHFDTRKDGQVSYNEFCDTILEEDFTAEMLKTKPHLDSRYDPAYAQRAMNKTADSQESAAVRKALRELGDMVYQRHDVCNKLFREFQKMTHEPVVSNVMIKKALGSIGITFKLEDIDRCLLHNYPDGDLNKVPYVEFFKTLITSHHDFAMVR